MYAISEGERLNQRRVLIEKINTEARNGNLQSVKDLCEESNIYSVHACSYAAINDHYDIVNYFIEKGYGVHGEGLLQLHKMKKNKIIEYIHQKNGWILSAPEVWKNLYVL